MKIIHTSDWHLGKSLFGQSLIDDQSDFIGNFFLPLVQKETPDIVIISGDIFDRNVAPAEAIRLFENFIGKMAELQIPLAVITGNHDSRDRIALCPELLRGSGIFIYTATDSFNKPVELCVKNEKLRVYPLPFFSGQQAIEHLGRETDSYPTAFADIISEIKALLEPDYINILAAHCFVTGASLTDSENPVYVGNSAQVSRDLFGCFDYTALGHLHSPQSVGETVRYSGSPLKYSFDEEHQTKCVLKAEFTDKKLTVTPIPVPPKHDLRTVKGSFDEITELGKSCPSDDYIHIILTDRFPIYMPVDRLREYFPNILNLSYESLASVINQEAHTIDKSSSDEEIFRQFMRQMCGEAPKNAETDLFMSCLNEVES